MDVLLKKATIVDPNSEYNGQEMDLLIKEGVIYAIERDLTQKKIKTFDCSGAFVSPGWMDVGVQTGDPGFEHREDLQSVAKAAAAGGYTAIACQPNTDPVIHSKSEVLYIRNNTKDNLVDFLPIGALSKNCEGMEITEMYDMYHSGAIAFSDGNKPVQHAGVMMRALQYVKAFDGVVLSQAQDQSIVSGGLMHEGTVSTSMGVRGLPNLAEELMVQRDIYLAEYTDSKLHLANISTAGAVKAIKNAKAKGLAITASVPAINLVFEDKKLLDFDSNLKVMPPLREKADRKALIKGVLDGTIDCIVSNHVPWDTEAKNLEFAYAQFGVIGLETCFPLINTFLSEQLSPAMLVDRLALNPRRIFQLEVPEITLKRKANLTIFDTRHQWTFEGKNIFSKSKNTPFINQSFKGKILGVVNNNQSVFYGR